MTPSTTGPGSPETEQRILDVAIDVLGARPDAGMGDVAAAAGVVRRTVYGYFPTRADLVTALARCAVDEIARVLTTSHPPEVAADAAWADFVGRLWPVAHRYRVLIVLRRGEFGADIHAILRPIETRLTELVERGQRAGAFGDHLPADVLGQLAWSAVFTIADGDHDDRPVPVDAAVHATLLLLGVAPERAHALARDAG
ncbi:TetR/AcrR family transcriptional regulator [Microbacterium sp. M1A1_1b]